MSDEKKPTIGEITRKAVQIMAARQARRWCNPNPILARLLLPPGIYWTQRTNRQSTVEIVR